MVKQKIWQKFSIVPTFSEDSQLQGDEQEPEQGWAADQARALLKKWTW